MEINEFQKIMKEQLNILNIQLNFEQIEKFYRYMNLLLEWNEKINLTAITDVEEVVTKHFVDSLTILKYIKGKDEVIDVGTGAGFPGIPLKIIKDDIRCTLLDSLNKRLVFLEEVLKELNLKDTKTVHARAEELSITKEHREKYDIAVSRAVAQLNILLEYLSPYVKVGGKCICMKGPNIEEELEQSKKAIQLLGLKIDTIEKIELPNTEMVRNILIFEKVTETRSSYPRQNGKIKKMPL